MTQWIEDLKAGNQEAATDLWQRYFDKLIIQARKRLGQASRRIADEEDVVVNVFKSLCEGAKDGEFKLLQDRNDLWKLLIVLTKAKSANQIRWQTAQKRGGKDLKGESILDVSFADGLNQVLNDEPTPDMIVDVTEQHGVLMAKLSNDLQRQIATLKLEGNSNPEISDSLNISLRSVERKLKLIREIWINSI